MTFLQEDGRVLPLTRNPAVLDHEADHRIANNLGLIISLLRLRARNIGQQQGVMDCADVSAMLDDIAARVETVAQLHRMLSHSYRNAMVEVGSYLRDLGVSLTRALAQSRDVQVVLVGSEPCTLAPDQVLTLGLLVSELVSNSVKYAHPTGLPVRIDMSCRQNGGRLTVEIADDGVGLPENFDPTVDGSLGLRIVRSMAMQLGATLEFDSNELGTRVRLELPVPANDVA